MSDTGNLLFPRKLTLLVGNQSNGTENNAQGQVAITSNSTGLSPLSRLPSSNMYSRSNSKF